MNVLSQQLHLSFISLCCLLQLEARQAATFKKLHKISNFYLRELFQ